MLGFSLTKILVTILIVVAVWRIFGMVESYRRSARQTETKGPPKALEFHACPRCGDYVAKGKGCSRCDPSA